MGNVYYITFGTFEGLKEYSLYSSPAANQKGSYIIEKLDSSCPDYKVITLSETDKKKPVILPRKTVPCLNHGEYTVWMTFGKPCWIFRRAHRYLREQQLKSFLSTLGPDDVVVVYHSLLIAQILTEAKNKYRFKLVLELEEIYQDVVPCSKAKATWERKVISVADGYILATEALSKQIPVGRPYIVINGTYRSEPSRNVYFDDDKIHCVYAGTFDPTKGGAAAAAAAAAFLSQNYHVHILGFGTEKETENLKKQIADVKKTAKCTLTYDGLMSGEAYIQFLQKCHIGLCTQIPDAKYTETSFPSKVLVYLANGLRVLSVRIPAVEQSGVGDMLYYYDEQKSEKIAEAIQRIDVTVPYDSRERLKQLDKETSIELKELIRKVSR